MRQIERGTLLLGKYRVDSIIGRGGMGLVFKAWHLGLDEEVAIKLLRDDIAIADETIARFLREAQAAAKLKSEHIARIIDVGAFQDGKPYLVMEFLEGQDVGQLIAERGRLQPSLAIDLVIQACEALAEAHSLGIVHRDIKPTNLFLTSRPDGSVLLKILDFGISKSPAGADLSLTQTWSLLGSPAYMSPEQMRSARHVDARTDVWSLGAVLYEAIEGQLPFRAESFSEMCVMVAVDPPAPTAAMPRELASVLARCLAKNPADRYPSVADLACDLACLAREPDKAQAMVDRMYRMLRRGAFRRTPASGVPLVARRSSQFSDAATPGTELGIAPLPATHRPSALRVAAAASPVDGVPLAVARAGSPPASALAGAAAGAPRLTPRPGFAGAPPHAAGTPLPLAAGTPLPLTAGRSPPPTASAVLGSGVLPASAMMAAAEPLLGSPHAPFAPLGTPSSTPSGFAASYTYSVSPVPLGHDARFLRPGFELPRGAAALTMTHVVRRDRGWLVSLIAAAIVLAAAAAVILATRTSRATEPAILRIIPGAASPSR